MSHERQTPENAVDRFLEKLGEPSGSETDVHDSAERLLRRLEREYRSNTQRTVPALNISGFTERLRWPAFAAAVVMLAVAGLLLRIDPNTPAATVVEGAVSVLAGDDSRTAGAGATLETDSPLRAGDRGAVLSLPDHSRVEVAPSGEFSIVRTADGLELRLVDGRVIVDAEQQSRGRLRVRMRDCVVSVTGTVFAVRAESMGSRITVIEGEVRLEQRFGATNLAAGQQVATSPLLGTVQLEQEIAWSRNARSLVQLLQSPSPQSAPASEFGRIEGAVTNLLNDGPLSGAVVYLQSWQARSRLELQMRTRDDGRFAFDRVPPGTYLLVASKERFWMPAAQGTPSATPTFSVVVPAGGHVRDVHLRMVPSSSISGRVLEANGEPARYVALQLFRMEYRDNGLRRLAPANESGVTTDERGEYTFTDILPGEYYIKTALDSNRPVSLYFPGVTSPTQAQPTMASPGSAVTGVDFTIPAVRLFSVRFKAPQSPRVWTGNEVWVSNQEGRASNRIAPSFPAAAVLTLTPNEPVVDEQTNFARRNAREAGANVKDSGNGEYAISGIPGGRYRLTALWRGTPSWGPNGNMNVPIASLEEDVEVLDRDVDLGELAFKPRFSIPVRITFADGSTGPLHFVAMPLFRFGPAGALYDTGSSLTIDGLSDGAYALDFTLPPDRYISVARYGGRDALYDPMVVDGTDRGALEIVVDGPAGAVEGVLRNAKDESVGNVRVVLVPPAYQRDNPYLFKTTTTDHTGAFTFTQVPPADYRVYAWEFTPGDAFLDHDWLLPYETRGAPVTVRRGLTSTVDVRVIPGDY